MKAMGRRLPKVVILGAGGFARELISWVGASRHVSALYADGDTRDELHGIRIERDLNALRGAIFLLGVGDPTTKEKLWNRALAAGLEPSNPLIHPSVIVGDRVVVGKGSVICPGVILTCDIKIGSGVLINIGCTVGHDAQIGSFATLSPGAHVSGNVQIGQRAYIGTGAVIRERVEIGVGSVLGMGSTLVKSIPDDQVWIGSPATEMKKKK